MALYLITGTSRGLGRELALQVLQQGHTVHGVSRSFEPELSALAHYTHHQVDLTDLKTVESFLTTHFGELVPDYIILNAGLITEDLVSGILQTELFDQCLKANLHSPYYFIAHFLPLFQRRGFGTFCAISSLSGVRGLGVKGVVYPVSKAGLNMLFEALRLRFQTSKIRFVSVIPGRLVEDPKKVKWGLSISYRAAAQKSLIAMHKGCEVIYFPRIASAILRGLTLLPDWMIARLLKGRTA